MSRARDERGAVLIVSSLSVVALLGFAAVAVDLAAAWSQDRQNQGAVDTGTIAGGIQTSHQTRAAAIAGAQAEVIRITYESLSPAMAFAEWDSCEDADKPVAYTTSTAIAQGVDHPIDTAPAAGAPSRTDRVWCDEGNINSRPYTLQTETGNVAQALHDGLIDGLEGTTARLLRSENLVPVGADMIDDTPLWAFLNETGKGVCGTPTSHVQIIDCLDNVWVPDDGPIFDDLIIEEARWGWVPVFWSDDYGAGTTEHNIKEFIPVWIQTTLWSCNSSSCRAIHDPGEPLGGTGANPGNTKIEAMTAIQLPALAVSEWIIAAGPGGAGFVRYTIIE